MRKIILILTLTLILAGCGNSTFSIYDRWETNNNNLYIFNEDNTFFFYNDVENLKTNYFSGNFTIKNKTDALEELNLTKDDLKHRNWKAKNVYSIKLFINSLNFEGETFENDENAQINLMLYNDTNSNDIILYDITNGSEMYLVKEGNEHSHGEKHNHDHSGHSHDHDGHSH